ncbi:MAG: hypothetical protein LBJ97_04825 [Mycoplasmataceae bacterium]|nr:hypothetical protein [Mycoplasmataceae bacterium]
MKYKYSITKRIDENNGEVDVMKIGFKEPTIKVLLKQILATQLEHTEILKEHTSMLKEHGKRITELEDRLINLENHVIKLDDKVTKLDSRITNLENK